MRYTLNNEFLRSYWSPGLAPAPAGFLDTLSWLALRFEPLADKPGGTALWVTFWLSAACGFALSVSRSLGVVLATVSLSAFALAALRLVPLHDRISLWVVPSLYFGVALFGEGAVRYCRDAYVRGRWTRLVLGVVAVFFGFALCSDIFRRGKETLKIGHALQSNHGVNDRDAVQWLMRQRQHADALITTHLALPAIWWYGRIPLSGPDMAGSRQPDGGPIFEVAHSDPGSECQRNQLRDALKDQRRVLVYLGFPDVPSGFDDLLLRSLSQLGVITAQRRFADIGRAAVIDLGERSNADPVAATRPDDGRAAAPSLLDGCVVVQLASRW